MRVAALSRDFSLQPFKAKYIQDGEYRFLEWGLGRRKPRTLLHSKIPPKMRFVAPDIVSLSNAHAYFYGRNKVILALDKKRSYDDLLLYVRLNVHRSFSGKVIRVEELTNRLFYDHKVVNSKYPDFIKIASLVFIKKGERAFLTDYIDDEESTIFVDNTQEEVKVTRL